MRCLNYFLKDKKKIDVITRLKVINKWIWIDGWVIKMGGGVNKLFDLPVGDP